jgi:hypothetical protein
MQAEVTDLAGVKARHNPERTHTRHGTEHGTVTLGGRRLPVTRPRVRTVGDEPEEATLGSHATFADTDLSCCCSTPPAPTGRTTAPTRPPARTPARPRGAHPPKQLRGRAARQRLPHGRQAQGPTGPTFYPAMQAWT